MFKYDLLHLIMSAIFSFVAIFGGIYALRTLKMLYGTPEVLKSQRKIWVPILVAGSFFLTSGIFHITEQIFSPIPEMNLVAELSFIAGLSLLALGIFRYWRLQKEYNETKHRALRKIKSP